MTQKSNTKSFKRPVLVAPDRASMLYVSRALNKAGVKLGFAIAKKRGYGAQALNALGKKPAVLLLVPSTKLNNDQFQLVRNVVEAGGIALAWGSGVASTNSRDKDQWLLERLLEQQGAVTTTHLQILIETAKVLAFANKMPTRMIAVKGRPNELTARFTSSLLRAGIETGKSKKGQWAIEVTTDGKAFLRVGDKRRLQLGYPSISAEMFALLLRAGSNDQLADPVIEPSLKEIGQIARPPARLLSETTSKRLAGEFGFRYPTEHLCKSASEAVRFASSFKGEAVAKLVRPELENKTALGAVKTGVTGPAAMRRAVHELEAIASSLGPPKPLGILVAKQLNAGIRIWMKINDHVRFGRIVLIGSGDNPHKEPATALAIQITATQALRSLDDAGLAPRSKNSVKLALAIAKFSTLVHKLSRTINRAEIDPLIAIDDEDEALALDLLVAIGAP